METIIIVSAFSPELSLKLMGHYRSAYETRAMHARFVLNKMHLLTTSSQTYIEQQMAIYRSIGYRLLIVSDYIVETMDPCRALLTRRTSLFCDDASVGKLRLLHAFLSSDNKKILVNSLSDNSGLKQHTTTDRLYPFRHRAHLSDVSGIAECALWHPRSAMIACCFVNFRDDLSISKFYHWRHDTVPDYVIRGTLKNSAIACARFNTPIALSTAFFISNPVSGFNGARAKIYRCRQYNATPFGDSMTQERDHRARHNKDSAATPIA